MFDGSKQSDYATVCMFILQSQGAVKHHFSYHSIPMTTFMKAETEICDLPFRKQLSFSGSGEVDCLGKPAAWNLTVKTVLPAASLNEVLRGISLCIRVVAAQAFAGN